MIYISYVYQYKCISSIYVYHMYNSIKCISSIYICISNVHQYKMYLQYICISYVYQYINVYPVYTK